MHKLIALILYPGRLFLIIAVFLILNSGLSAINLDSLSRLLPQKKGVEKAQALYNLAESSLNMDNLQEAIRFYQQSAEVEMMVAGTDSRNYIDRMGDIGYCYLMLNQYEKALNYFEKGRDLAIKTNYTEEAANNYSNIATIYVEWGDYGKAITHFQKAMDIDRKANRTDQFSTDLNNIGKVYELSGKYQQAVKYYLEALEIERKAGNKARIAIRLNNLGTVYKAWEKYPEALNYFQQALEIERSLGDNEKVGKRLAYIGATYLAMGQFDQCFSYLQQGLAILSKTDLTDELARIQNSFGKYYLAKKNNTLAVEHLLLSQDHALENNLKPLQISNLKTLYEIYEQTGQSAKALAAFKQHQQLKDSVFSKESDNKLAEFQARFENEKMQIENEMLRNDANSKKKIYLLTGILSASLVLILLSIIFILRLRARNARQSKEIAEKNAALLTEEMEVKNRELTYNALAIIRNNEATAEVIESIEQAVENGHSVDGLESILQNIKTLERDKSWKEFEVRFTQVHKDFYDRLTAGFPDLTPNEIKLCAFLRLNMTTKDISAITRQSVHSINVARTRLRKKMNLANSDENLINFLIKL